VASFTVTDLNGTIAQLQAQINSLSKQLADANSTVAANKIAADSAAAAKVVADAAILKEKADYNKLATAWNKAFPKKKVALKK
jgi:predicted nucleic acid binding AN1-type Zn finger protein